ncbi:hypothetical protein KJ765_06645 [Candidatus Micrarchaeota archaeon]|nr:hypothetical protein [Candidatus Micrarchaeota archaeon]
MRLAILLALLLSLPLGYAQESFQQTFIFLNPDTLQPVTGIASLLFVDEQGGRITSEYLLGNESRVSFALPTGSWHLMVTVNDRDTNADDYASFRTLEVTGAKDHQIGLLSVGSVSGVVVDSQGKVVEGALVRMQCLGSNEVLRSFEAEAGDLITDEFGSFIIPLVPTRSCRLLGSKTAEVGFLELRLEPGEYLNARLSLNEQKAPVDPPEPVMDYTPLGLIALLFLVLGGGYYFLARKNREPPKVHHVTHKVSRSSKHSPQKTDSKTISLTPKMRAILNTLQDNERRTVEFLLEERGRARFSKVFYKLLIPKTTLSRVIFALESKKIIETRKFGKVRELKLTEWFLSEK